MPARNRDWVPGNPFDRSVRGFCIRHGSSRGPMSESKYRELKKQKRGPKEIELNGMIIITVRSELAWERENEKPKGALARLVAREAAARHQRAKLGAAARAAKKKDGKT